MLKIDFQNLFKVAEIYPEHGLNKAELEAYQAKFVDYKRLVQSRNQGFYDLPYNTEEALKIQNFANKISSLYQQIVILGIGGSMLGPQCILSSLDNFTSRQKRGFNKNLQVFTIDNIDPFLIQEINSQLDLKNCLFLVQTKSGTTPETISQYAYFRDLVEKANLEVKKHFVFVTDPEVGYLRKIAIQEEIPVFDLASNVGGRFSVLSAMGLLISALVGLDIQELLEGGRQAVEEFFMKSGEFEKNDSEIDLSVYNLALSQFLLSKKGKSMAVLMPYSSQLKTISNWYVQLLSESIGKRLNLDQKEVFTGITPIPALGVTDQHSQLQLFKEGPNDKLVIFLKVDSPKPNLLIPEISDSKFRFLKNKTFKDLLEAELQGTKQSLTESARPNITISISEVNELTLGKLFLILEISVAFLGEMLEIDTFNQPGVERSKVLTKEILEIN